MSIIDVKNLNYSINGKAILNDISFQVQKGDFISIIGPNGAGKTTLLRCLTRFLCPTSGDIFVGGKNYRKISRKNLARFMAYVPQKTSFAYPFTVEEFVRMGRYPYSSLFSIGFFRDTDLIEAILKNLKIDHLKDHLVSSLSGGEMQKTVIASCLAQTPEVLLLDEVMTYLDPYHQRDIYSILSNLNLDKKITVVSVTHNLNFAMGFSKKLIALDNGKIVFWGDTNNIDEALLKNIYGIEFSFLKHPKNGERIIVPNWKKDN